MNTVGYFEIQADDLERAKKFYTTLFGWNFVKDPTLPVEYYRIENAGIYGGLLPRPVPLLQGPSGTNAYCCSVQVEDFDETSNKIAENGGIVALEKFAVVGKCWQGYFLDTEGNTFGIFQPDTEAK